MSGFSRYTLFFISFVLTETFAYENYTVWSINILGSQPEVKRSAMKWDLWDDNHVSTTLLCTIQSS